eukprot:303504-Rhodomonas_salina.2
MLWAQHLRGSHSGGVVSWRLRRRMSRLGEDTAGHQGGVAVCGGTKSGSGSGAAVGGQMPRRMSKG